MSHSYISALFHCVFSTKQRQPMITEEICERLWSYLCGIARENKMSALAVGGIEDHIHIVLSLPSTINIAKALQLIKGGSSKWIHDTFPAKQHFGWQEGYAAFSIGVSQLEKTLSYVASQTEHHRQTSFQDELIAFLKKHQIEYDPRYIWD